MSLSFTFIDLLVVGTILVSAGYGVWRGLVSETLSIVAFFTAALATLWFGRSVIPLTHSLVASDLLAAALAYVLVFLIVLIPLQFLSYRFSQQVRGSTVGPLDRALGAAFGVLRGLAIVGLAYLALSSIVRVDAQPDYVKEARTLPLMQSATEVILSLVPRRESKPVADVAAPGEVAKVSSNKASETPARSAEITPKAKPEAAPRKGVKKTSKSYGERDRRALDSLLETTGGNSTP